MLEAKQYKNLKLLTPEQVADILQIKVQTLAVWRCRRKDSPNYISIGGKVLYHESDVLAWLESKKVICTH